MPTRDALSSRLRQAGRVARTCWSVVLGMPIVRLVRGRQLRRMRPFANGVQHGEAIVRYYWERFLDEHHADVRGRCLEIGSTHTLRRRGGPAVSQAHALDLTRHSEEIAVVADLSRADAVPADTYDCFVVPFTMHLIFDIEAALYHSLRILKPGGVLLANFPCVDYYFPRGLDMRTGRPLFVFWWFTPLQVENLLRRVGLTSVDYTIRTDGNLFARVAYQMNMPSEELTRAELDHVDEGHPLLVSVRAVKPPHWCASRPEYRDSWTPDVEPAKWSSVTGHYPRR